MEEYATPVCDVAADYRRSNSMALLLLILNCRPDVLDRFKRFGEVPGAFAKLDAEALASIRRCIDAPKYGGGQVPLQG